MEDLIEQFRDKIKELANEIGLIFEDDLPSRGKIILKFTPVFPLWLNIDIDEKEDTAFIYASARAHGIIGDMSDYHDLLSSIVAICLRLSNLASGRILKIFMEDILPGEIYACNIVFDKQPPATFININQSDFNSIEQILQESAIAARTISKIWSLSGEGMGEEEYLHEEGLVWASTLASQTKVKPESRNVNIMQENIPHGSTSGLLTKMFLRLDLRYLSLCYRLWKTLRRVSLF